MMILLVRHAEHPCRLREQKSQESVYVDYVQTSPWNWTDFLHPLGVAPRFKGVGQALITAAIDLSRDEGCQGRVALHSLPQAEGFYGTTCRMITMGPDHSYYGLRYFEMTTELSDRLTEVK